MLNYDALFKNTLSILENFKILINNYIYNNEYKHFYFIISNSENFQNELLTNE